VGSLHNILILASETTPPHSTDIWAFWFLFGFLPLLFALWLWWSVRTYDSNNTFTAQFKKSDWYKAHQERSEIKSLERKLHKQQLENELNKQK
jgi:hypothetical protein